MFYKTYAADKMENSKSNLGKIILKYWKILKSIVAKIANYDTC